MELWEASIQGLTEKVSTENESKIRESIATLCDQIIYRSEAKQLRVQHQMVENRVPSVEGWLEVLTMANLLWEEERHVAQSIKQSVLAGIEF